MLKKIEETRKKASIMLDRRDQNERSYLQKMQRKQKMEADLQQQREEFQQQSLEKKTRIKLNRMFVEENNKQTSQQVKNLSKLSLDLKNKMEDQHRLNNYTRAQLQKRSEKQLQHQMARERKNQEDLNKFVYDLRVDNEQRQIQQSKVNIKHFEDREMQLLSKLKDTMSRHDQAISEFAQV